MSADKIYIRIRSNQLKNLHGYLSRSPITIEYPEIRPKRIGVRNHYYLLWAHQSYQIDPITRLKTQQVFWKLHFTSNEEPEGYIVDLAKLDNLTSVINLLGLSKEYL